MTAILGYINKINLIRFEVNSQQGVISSIVNMLANKAEGE